MFGRNPFLCWHYEAVKHDKFIVVKVKLTSDAKNWDVMGLHVDRQAVTDKQGRALLFHAERFAVHPSLFIIICDVARRKQIRPQMDLLTYLVLLRQQRCLKPCRARSVLWTPGWTWPLTPWWTWRRTVIWPPSWGATWRDGQTRIVKCLRPKKKLAAWQGELILITGWKYRI